METIEALQLIKTLMNCNNYGNPEMIKRKIVEICEDCIKKELDRQALNKSIKNINV